MYERVAELNVFLWGHHVGSLAPESGSFFVFQYDPEFVRTGLQIAPFLMDESGKWRLAPAYDLTGYHSPVEDKDFEAWSNPHALSVNGKTGLITDDDLLLVAERFGIGTAKRALKEIEEVLA